MWAGSSTKRSENAGFNYFSNRLMKSECRMTSSSARRWWGIWNGAVAWWSKAHRQVRIRLTKTHPCHNGFGEKLVIQINLNRRIQNKNVLVLAIVTSDNRRSRIRSLTRPVYRGRGWSGTDFKTAPAAGASLVELMLNGKSATVDITPFRFERFAEGQLLKGEYGYGRIWK